MTSGMIFHSPVNPYDELFLKSWSGSDGKYQAGPSKIKWNPYSMHLVQESFQYGQTAIPTSTISGPGLMSWDAADEFRLQSKIVEAIKGHKFNLAVNVAQAHQLVNMVESTLLHFGRSLRYLKRGDFTSAARELGVGGKVHQTRLNSRDVSGRWLELQYGWLPSLSDAFEAAKAYEAISQGRSARIVAVVGKGAKIDRSASPGNYSSEGYHILTKKCIIELEEDISVSRSLGLLDPLSVLWEITPYSFVADWFLPIGSYLENLSVIPSLKGRFLTTLYSRWDTRFTRAIDPAYSGTRRYGHGRDVTRQVLMNLTTQRPTFVDPITALTRRRIASAVSLFHQAVT